MNESNYLWKSDVMTQHVSRDLQLAQPQLPIGNIEAYIQRVNEIPLLTAEEEYDLARAYQKTGDLQAAQKLVLAHLRYVVRVSKGYLGYGLPLADLIQEGAIGLMKAVKRFDPDVGVRLVSFAVHWIKAEIHEYVLRHWRIVKVATTKAQRKLFFNLRRARQRLGWSTDEEVMTLAKELGVPTAEVRRMEERLNARDVAFDLPAGDSAELEDKRALVPAEYLEDKDANPETQLEAQNWSLHSDERFQTAFQQLDPRSQNILKERWLVEKKATLQALALAHGVSPERIRQLEKNSIDKLRKLILQREVVAV
jgi:RNA polymerase sigma-32 factor